MIGDRTGSLVELSGADLDLVGAAANGVNINLANLVDLNIAVNVQTANQIAALSGGVIQNIGQLANFSQFIHVS